MVLGVALVGTRWFATLGMRETKDLATRRINRGLQSSLIRAGFAANVALEGWLGRCKSIDLAVSIPATVSHGSI